MRYLFLLWGDEAAELDLSDAERRAIVDAHGAFTRDQVAAGRSISGEPLGPSADAVILETATGRPVDGPFLETKEQIGGFYLIECADLDDAMDVARSIPPSPGLRIEIREIPA